MIEQTDGMARQITLVCQDCGQGCKLKLIGVPAWNDLIEFCPISGEKVHWQELVKKPKSPKLTQQKLGD